MNIRNFSEAMNRINDEYLSEAIHYRHKSRKFKYLKRGAAAACLCLAVTGGCLYHREHPYPVREIALSEPFRGSEEEIAVIPHWEELNIYEQYAKILWNGLQYHTQKGIVPKEKLGGELADITAEGRDEYAELAGEDAERYLPAVLYEISHISPECAAAVRYEGTDVYYAAVNSDYRPNTLGQFIEDLDLKNILNFGDIYYDYQKPSGEYACICCENAADEKIWEMLLSNVTAENIYDDLNFNLPKKVLDIGINLPILGYENISLSITEDGYIITNILDTGKMFHIGEEHTRAFINYVLKECDGYELVYSFDGESTPE